MEQCLRGREKKKDTLPFDFILYLINPSKDHYTFILYYSIFKKGKTDIFL